MIYFCLSGFLFISIIGFVLHMFYDVADKNKALRFLFAVNNSPWEQIKLAFFPTIVWGLISILLGINNAMFVLSLRTFNSTFTLLFSLSAPTGQARIHCPQPTQGDSFSPSPNAQPTMVLKPRLFWVIA